MSEGFINRFNKDSKLLLINSLVESVADEGDYDISTFQDNDGGREIQLLKVMIKDGKRFPYTVASSEEIDEFITAVINKATNDYPDYDWSSAIYKQKNSAEPIKIRFALPSSL